MNPKFYPALRESAEMAALALPQIRVQVAAAKKVEDLLVPVYNALDNIGISAGEKLREVAMVLFNGMNIEVNNYYNGHQTTRR